MAKFDNTDKVKLNKAEDPVYRMQEYHLDIQNNHIYLFGDHNLAGTDAYGDAEPGVNFTMANRFVLNMHLCMKTSQSPVVIHMKTNGGDWIEGMAMFDMLISYPHDTTILNYSHARSMSSIIFQAVTKRVMMPNSHFMFHEGTYGDEGNMRTVMSGMEFYKDTNRLMLEIYVRRMKQGGKFSKKKSEWIADMLMEQMRRKDDVFLTAKETVDWGLADEIFDGDWTGLTKYTKAQSENAVEFSSNFLD